MGFQSYVQQLPEPLGPLGQRWGDGHRPARCYHAGFQIAQVDSVTIVDANDGTTITVVVDGITFTSLDTVGTGAAGIAANLVALINAHPSANQIVKAADQGSGVFYLTAKNRGTAFTATAGAAGGTSTATRAAVTANNAGVDVDAGMPMFRAAGGSNASLVKLPTADTDIFVGIVQFRHEDINFQLAPSAQHAYPAGSQIPVDPDGMHVVLASEAVTPGAPVRVTKTTGLYRTTDTGSTAQISTVTFSAVNSTLYVLGFTVNNLNGTQSFYRATYTSDGSATATEIRDGLQASMISQAIPITPVDLSTDGLTLTSDVAGASFTVAEDPTGSIAFAAVTASVTGTLLLKNATWESVAAAGNKALVAIDVP